MDATQYARWEDFALRMARQGWPTITEQRKGRLVTELTGFLDAYRADAPRITSWDNGDLPVCDEAMEWFDAHDHGEGHNTFYTQIQCCLRSGLDLVAEASAGVLGFTVGDVRRMYEGTIPAWIAAQYNGDLTAAPDSADIWL